MRKLAPLAPLPFLVVLAAWGSARMADAGGAALGAGLSAIASVVGAQQRPIQDDSELDPFMLEPSIRNSILDPKLPPGDASVSAIAETKRSKGHAGQVAPAATRSLHVSAETVLRLSESRVAPKGVPVPANGVRPAGILLKGVGGLGIGLRDGDVLTRALGQPALSSSAVVRAILVARANRVKVLEGEFYRGNERWTLRVEQPYLDENRFERVKVTLRER